MELKADLHCHGPEEWLNTRKWNPLEIAALAEGKLDVLAITEMGEQDRRFGELKFASIPYEDSGRICVAGDEIYIPEKKVLLLKTQEVAASKDNKPQGHLLIIGGKSKFAGGSLEENLEKAENEGAVVIASHMFSGGHEALAGIGHANSPDIVLDYFSRKKIHAIEWNGQMSGFNPLMNALYDFRSELNDKAAELARKEGIALVANTDAHSAPCIGKSYTVFQTGEDWRNYAGEIKDAIKRNEIADLSMEKAGAFSADRHAIKIRKEILKNKRRYSPSLIYELYLPK